MSSQPDRIILPQNVSPLHYKLQLEPYFDTFKFDGTVSIDLKVNDKESDFVELNTFELDIHEAKINDVKSLETVTDEENQTSRFKFPAGTLKDSDNVTIDIKFTGILNDTMAGFYRAKYIDNATGETKYMATTQMEPTDARRAFPCFDEPNLKASFEITLVSDPKLTHLSNMDVKKEEIFDGKKFTYFNPTPKMSTYLVAFIVAELEYVECKDFRIPVRVYATPGSEHLGQYAANLTAKTLSFFEKAFGIEYPLPKMDSVAVHEFSAGAMENWGLVTYRVVDLLLDEKNASLERIKRVAEVVQHELAHQWFGNLVTMDWWEGLWLNEGFATWMSWYACNQFQPEWKVWEQYVADDLQSALGLDSLRSSHPIEVPVKRADEINQIFDHISYAKGSSLLRMISQWLGEDVFVKGVSQYLNKFKFGNAKTEDLWDALSEASGKDVRNVMDIWTKKVGFPIVSVTEDGHKITFKQNRYLNTADVKPEEDKTLYPVFLSLKTNSGVDHSLTLDERELTVTVEDVDFIKTNANQAGIYVTSYSDDRWTTLSKQSDLLTVEDRTGLVADCKTLSLSGYTSTKNFLQLISQWKNEDSFVVWEQMINSLGSLKAAWAFEPKETLEALDEFTRQLVSEKTHSLGWEFSENESYASQRLKVEMFSSSAAAKDPVVVKAALKMFEKYTSGDSNAIPPLIKSSVFGTVARDGNAKNYEKLFAIYKNPSSSDEKLSALRCLGRFEDPALMKRTLGYLFDGTVLNQDIYIPMGGMRGHKEGIKTLWAWTKENWDALHKKFPPSLTMLGSILTVATSGFTSRQAIDEIEDFFKDKSTKGFDQSLAQTLDTITSKANWVDRDREVVVKFLKEHNYYK
ncbi:M1 family metallopeptidase [Kluyveromyces lactis]|uniref:Aminopeptidase n=1 Tax=Kluyveromyces lactis (strain ATCC 8585 / CBS 2359 / DSM 70799 / NBRC 1267 / NRRL Y-1140 / WM37) TaxID=284590 RepID=Q6CTP7_KLULA|nr:uncharacterized protein KLLA0_C11033g [Kluyveromyces lactis]CAH01543.2 KLLA0C11033p [Kluyveromyces lactis]|eukprot:XP_452692.2 uncharacterized protein KLLA0_C11033g [Kluyveromyces lactis]